MRVFCPDCKTEAQLSPEKWRCDCKGAWETIPQNSFNIEDIDKKETSLWRYHRLLNLDFDNPSVTLGAGWTPLLPANLHNSDIYLKIDYLSPSGSFKDRGTEVEINTLVSQKVNRVTDDSSGNAGSSLAAYAARAGISAEIFVPEYASPVKKAQIGIYGAKVHSIPGKREDAKKAAILASERGCVYASHAYHPCFLLGQQTVAWEIWEQLGQKAPDWYVVPVGQGVHLLGAWLGFTRLKKAGVINKLPHMVAVQPTLLAPVVEAFNQHMDEIPNFSPKQTSIAEGLAISKPVRWKRLLQALQDSNGLGFSVDEEKIIDAQNQLAKKGFFVEPTSATVIAALPKLLKRVNKKDLIVIALTGSGLKGTPSINHK